MICQRAHSSLSTSCKPPSCYSSRRRHPQISRSFTTSAGCSALCRSSACASATMLRITRYVPGRLIRIKSHTHAFVESHLTRDLAHCCLARRRKRPQRPPTAPRSRRGGTIRAPAPARCLWPGDVRPGVSQRIAPAPPRRTRRVIKVPLYAGRVIDYLTLVVVAVVA